ncbi:MAG: pyridoxal-phosphate dependent enzyme [Alphaproteobacteria bacterium]|nr:pyridoxal-phosphate dependent enzyme [Alphaproteobacteria bacterium]
MTDASPAVTYQDLQAAAARLKGHIPEARVIPVPELAEALGAKEVMFVVDTPHPLGMEGAQHAGNTFKLRGAANAIFCALDARQGEEAITFVTASAGNHAQGVAAAVRRAGERGQLKEGDKAIIFVPETAPENKVENTRVLGGRFVEVRKQGKTFDDTKRIATEFADGKRATQFIPPFDDARVIAGQGTLGIEIFRHCTPDYIYAACGGGGLAAGLEIAAGHDSNKTRIIAVEPLYVPSAVRALMPTGAESRPVSHYKNRPVAGGINVSKIGDLPHQILANRQSGVATVTAEMIEYATLMAMDILKPHAGEDPLHEYTAELSAGTSLAALLNTPRNLLKGRSIAVIIGGANPEWEQAKLQCQVEQDTADASGDKRRNWNEQPLTDKVEAFPRMHALGTWVNMDKLVVPPHAGLPI